MTEYVTNPVTKLITAWTGANGIPDRTRNLYSVDAQGFLTARDPNSAPDASLLNGRYAVDPITKLITPYTGLGFDPEAQAIIMATNTLDQNRQNLIIDTVVALKNANLWARIDGMLIFSAADQAAALVDWKVTTRSASALGTITFTPDRGFQGDAVTGYVETGVDVSVTGPNYSLNSAFLCAWPLTDEINDAYSDVGTNAQSRVSSSHTVANTFTARSNGGTTLTVASASAIGLHAISRTSNVDVILSVNNTQTATATAAATVVPTGVTMRACAAGSVLSGRQQGMLIWGGGYTSSELSTMYGILNNYMQFVGAAAADAAFVQKYVNPGYIANAYDLQANITENGGARTNVKWQQGLPGYELSPENQRSGTALIKGGLRHTNAAEKYRLIDLGIKAYEYLLDDAIAGTLGDFPQAHNGDTTLFFQKANALSNCAVAIKALQDAVGLDAGFQTRLTALIPKFLRSAAWTRDTTDKQYWYDCMFTGVNNSRFCNQTWFIIYIWRIAYILSGDSSYDTIANSWASAVMQAQLPDGTFPEGTPNSTKGSFDSNYHFVSLAVLADIIDVVTDPTNKAALQASWNLGFPRWMQSINTTTGAFTNVGNSRTQVETWNPGYGWKNNAINQYPIFLAESSLRTNTNYVPLAQKMLYQGADFSHSNG